MKNSHTVLNLLRCLILTIKWMFCAAFLVQATNGGDTNYWTGAPNGSWHVSENWSLGEPVSGQDVRVQTGGDLLLTNSTPALASFVLEDGAALAFEGWESTLKADEITVAGTITHAPNMTDEPDELGDWIPEHRVLIEGGNMTVTAAGKIDADERGYRGGAASEHGRGPGRGYFTPTRGTGGGYGGVGGNCRERGAHGGIPYGDPDSPWQPGSGGGGSSDQGGHGGGAIRINLTGTLTVDGDITANGGTGSSDGSRGGGSGGGVWINCMTFDGSGQIQVNGGSAGGHGGRGGGGRIAIHFNAAAQAALDPTTLQFEMNYGASGGYHRPDAVMDFARGSLYYSDAGPFGSNWSQWSGWLYLPTNTLEMAGDLMVTDGRAGLATVTTLDVTGNLTIEDGAHLYLRAGVTDDFHEPGALLNVNGDFMIRSGGVFYPRSHPTNGAAVKIQVGSLDIETGGSINAEGRGFRGGSTLASYDPDDPLTGDGFGEGGGIAGGDSSGSSFYGGGGSYGGLGGDGHLGWRGHRYGEAAAPLLPGSGGAGRVAGYGGGRIWIVAGNGHVQIDGEINANGDRAPGNPGFSGGGSGGSVEIHCRTLDGSGKILVNGGNGSGNAGPGGGGRIALIYAPEHQSGIEPPAFHCDAMGGTSATLRRSQPLDLRMGTIYLPDTLLLGDTWSLWSGWLHISDNDSLHVDGSLVIEGGEAGLAEIRNLTIDGDLTVRNGGILYLKADATDALWEPGGMLDVSGNLNIADGGVIIPRSHPTNGATVKIRARNFAIDDGGMIDGSERGYRGREQPDLEAYADGAGGGGNTHGGGGGYGGEGGHGHTSAPGGGTYGQAHAPLEPGSGGGAGDDGGNRAGGYGGAFIWVETPGILRIDGEIRSNGQITRAGWGGGGSGGGIVLDAGRVIGSGSVRADGGDGISHGGGGGGGRIAFWISLPRNSAQTLARGKIEAIETRPQPSSFAGSTSVEGGTGHSGGDPGTVWWLIPQGTLIKIF